MNVHNQTWGTSMTKAKHLTFVVTVHCSHSTVTLLSECLTVFQLQPWVYPFKAQCKSEHPLEMMMNGLGMNGKNDDLWEAIIYLGLNRLCSQMLKTDLEGNNGEHI